jgi:hypothetical protein
MATERAANCDKHSAAKSPVVLYRSADDGWQALISALVCACLRQP